MPLIIDCQQNDETWHKARLGIPTASNFGKILTATGKVSESREAYMIELACEAVSGRSEETFVSYRMKLAKEAEEESRQVYAMNHDDLDVYQVGFVYKDERRMFGCSPDALVDENGAFETKDAQFTVQYDRLKKGTMVTNHIPQCQGVLSVCEREWIDFQSYCRGLPVLCIRNYRDEKYISRLSEEIDKFCLELAVRIRKLKEMEG